VGVWSDTAGCVLFDMSPSEQYVGVSVRGAMFGMFDTCPVLKLCAGMFGW